MLQNSLTKNVFLSLIFLFSSTALGNTYESVFLHQYTNDSGQKTSVKETLDSQNPVLVLLWANWCEPCKKELSWLVKELGQNDSLAVITVNVDDASDQAGAKQFLKALQSPWPSLFDVDGEQFYNYHQSGQLPLVLFFSSKGKLQQRFSHFGKKELTSVLAVVDKPSVDSSDESLGFTVTNRLRYREQNVPAKAKQKVVAERLNTHFAGGSYDLSLNYDLLHQTKDDGDWQTFEDEIGFSYGELRIPFQSQQLVTLRGGGRNLMVANGFALAARTNRDLNENLFVAGGFADYKNAHLNVSLFHGRIRNNLFPAIINPTSDLSETLPREVVSGGEIKASQFGPLWLRNTPAISFVSLERDTHSGLGFLEEYNDTRQSLSNELETPYFSLNGIWSLYDSDNDSHDDGSSNLLSLTFPAATLFGLQTSLSLSALRLNIPQDDIYQHISAPVLVDDLATPLLKQQREERQVKIRFSGDHLGGIFFEPLYTEQNTINKKPTDELFNLGSKLGFTDFNFKTQMSFVRKNERSTNQRTKEKIFAASFPIYGVVTGFAEVRSLKLTDLNNGSKISTGLREAQGLNLHWSPAGGHHLNFDLVHYFVSGFYLSQSGFSEKSIYVGKAKYVFAMGFIEWIEGKEPGGYVCTAGNCQYLEPRDGREINTGINYSF